MSLTDLGGIFQGAAAPAQIQGQQLQNQQNALQLQIQRNSLNALRGVDWTNPDSINNALAGSVRAGNLTQAAALQNLAWTAYAQQSRRTALSGLFGGGDTSEAQPAPQPQQQQWSPSPQERAEYQEIDKDLTTLNGIQDPGARQAMTTSMGLKYAGKGYDPALIHEVLGDTSPPAISAHQQYFAKLSDWQPGDPVPPHPTGNAASKAYLAQNQDVLDNERVRQSLIGLGILTGDPTEMVKALTAGRYTGAAAPGSVIYQMGQPTSAVPTKLVPGEEIANPVSGQVTQRNPLAPTFEQVQPANRAVVFQPETGATYEPGGAPLGPAPAAPAGAVPSPAAAPGAGAAPATAGLIGANGRLNPTAFFNSFVAPHEGGLNPSDMNGYPSNFGINQQANPEVDVKKLTQAGAANIFANKYYPSSANLSPALAAVNSDTNFLNEVKARQFLKESGGDWRRYMQLRENWLNQLAKTPDGQKYGRAWAKRDTDLINVATQLETGRGGAPAAGAAPAAPIGAAPAQAAPAAAPPLNPTPQGAAQAAAMLAPKYAAPPGRQAGPISGYQVQDIPPQQAIQMGLAPGRWQRTPAGELRMASKPPEGDVERVNNMGVGLQTLQELEQNQATFADLNRQRATGLGYAHPDVLGLDIPNPLRAYGTATDPVLGRMEAMSNAQTMMVKPQNIGRILTAELPIWSHSTQSLDKGGDVNQSILDETHRSRMLMAAKHSFFQTWLYQNGNLNGADEAFNDWWGKAQPPVQGQGVAAPSAQFSHTATNAKGERMGFNGTAWVPLPAR